MFPHDYFPAGTFAPAYFPPVAGPVVPPIPFGGHRLRRVLPVTDDLYADGDDFLTWFT